MDCFFSAATTAFLVESCLISSSVIGSLKDELFTFSTSKSRFCPLQSVTSLISFRFLKWFLKASLGMLFGLLFDPEALFLIPQYSFGLLLLRFLSLSCKSLW